jgi:hypothetical protein
MADYKLALARDRNFADAYQAVARLVEQDRKAKALAIEQERKAKALLMEQDRKGKARAAEKPAKAEPAREANAPAPGDEPATTAALPEPAKTLPRHHARDRKTVSREQQESGHQAQLKREFEAAGQRPRNDKRNADRRRSDIRRIYAEPPRRTYVAPPAVRYYRAGESPGRGARFTDAFR